MSSDDLRAEQATRLDPVIAPEALGSVGRSAPSGARAENRLVLLDCRAGANARADYAASHLPGAIFADLNADLAAPAPHPEHGGRHPLPEPQSFLAQLGRWGITPSSHVVAYDDQGGANAAARLWWMLQALGHPRVQVLDGGLQAALAAGHSLSSELPTPEAEPPYPAPGFDWPSADIADIEEVEQARTSSARRVLDVRAAARFRGESEPIDPIAGHIPGAINLPFAENLQANRFKPPAELRALYRELLAELPVQDLIVHCGSGVTACHTLLALDRAGLPGAKLYVGSWSEWCRQPARPRTP